MTAVTGRLDQIRDAARAAIHSEFSLLVFVLSADRKPLGTAKARLHFADSRQFGDLDREGYAFSIEGKVVLVFDSKEWDPEVNQVVDFGRGRVYQVEHVIDTKSKSRYLRCIATEVNW